MTDGNPFPCAEFSSQPYRTNYTQILTSDTIDATSYLCAVMWLDFDAKITSVNNTGNEKLTVEIFRQGAWSQLDELVNSSSTGWVSLHIRLLGILGESFQIRFIVHGNNSADIQHWQLDNIKLYGNCNRPGSLSLSPGYLNFTIKLNWIPPTCAQQFLTDFILDDESMEYGYRAPAGSLKWLGNKFIVGSQQYGCVHEIILYFSSIYGGSPQWLTVDLFDSTRSLIGSSSPFLVVNPDFWIVVPMNDIPYNGDFYTMVKFNSLPSESYVLGADEDGPNADKNLAWTIDSVGTWSTIGVPTAQPCVLLCRATVINYMDQSFNTADTNLIGYNVYRSGPNGPLQFIKRNQNPIPGTSYLDFVPGSSWEEWTYYVTALYQNLIDSSVLCEPSSDTSKFIYVGVQNELSNQSIIYPNPSVDEVFISTFFPVKKVEIYDLLGQIIYSTEIIETKFLKIDLTSFTKGIYLFRVATINGIHTEKVMITR